MTGGTISALEGRRQLPDRYCQLPDRVFQLSDFSLHRFNPRLNLPPAFSTVSGSQLFLPQVNPLISIGLKQTGDEIGSPEAFKKYRERVLRVGGASVTGWSQAVTFRMQDMAFM
jgi:hypothetical protein